MHPKRQIMNPDSIPRCHYPKHHSSMIHVGAFPGVASRLARRGCGGSAVGDGDGCADFEVAFEEAFEEEERPVERRRDEDVEDIEDGLRVADTAVFSVLVRFEVTLPVARRVEDSLEETPVERRMDGDVEDEVAGVGVG